MAIRAPDAALIPSVNPTAQPAPPQNIQVTPGAAGVGVAQAQAGVGRELGEFGDMLAKHAVAFQGLKNENDAKDADRLLTDQLIDLQFNPQTGFNTKLGRDAVDNYPEISKRANDLFKQHRDGLPNDQARSMFDASALRSLRYSTQSMASHAAQQNKIWTTQATEGQIQNQINVGAAYWNDDKKFGEVIQSIRGYAQSRGEELGQSPDKTQADTLHYISSAWQARLHSVMAHDVDEARRLYTEHSTELDAAHSAQIDGQITQRERLDAQRAEIDAARQERLAAKAERDAGKKAEDDWGTKILAGDPSVDLKRINNDPRLSFSQKLLLKRVMDADAKPEAASVVSADNTSNLIGRMRLPEGDPRKITDMEPVYEALINRDISKGDFEFAQKQFKEMGTPEGDKLTTERAKLMKAVEPIINSKSNMFFKDPAGSYQLLLFDKMVDDRIAEYRKTGKNPYDLFNPKKPDFLGDPQLLQTYQRSLDEVLKDTVDRLRRGSAPQVVPRQPGETPAQYLERTKAK